MYAKNDEYAKEMGDVRSRFPDKRIPKRYGTSSEYYWSTPRDSYNKVCQEWERAIKKKYVSPSFIEMAARSEWSRYKEYEDNKSRPVMRFKEGQSESMFEREGSDNERDEVGAKKVSIPYDVWSKWDKLRY
jgi:hypothetical protein